VEGEGAEAMVWPTDREVVELDSGIADGHEADPVVADAGDVGVARGTWMKPPVRSTAPVQLTELRC
jgi:hypothetical protein